MTVDKLKRINLVELLSRQWGMTFTPLPDGGHVACSPFRQESQASFYVACGADGHWVFYDHGAGCGGSLIDLMMQRLGTTEYSVAKKAALELAQGAGLRPEPKAPQSGKPRVDLNWLVGQLGGQSAAPSRTYLSGRGLPAELLDRLERERILLCNRLDGSEYCCFAVRDRAGQLVSLFNRKISGEKGPDRFLLGRQEPFCLDWQSLAGAAVVYLCESIIDALSLQTLHPEALILALAGAAYDPARLQLPEGVRLIEAFDADAAGRAAAARLRQTCPDRVESYDLQGYHDVNDLLRRADRPLTLEERLRIALSDKPSRELAAQYGIHHSRICDIRNEAKALLAEQWQGRRPGRKPKPQPDEKNQQLEQERDHYKKQYELAQMRNNYLNFEKDMVRRHAKEEGRQAVELLDRLQKKKRHETPILQAMIESDQTTFPDHLRAKVLECYGLTPSRYARLLRAEALGRVRESAIPEKDIQAAIDLFIEYPQIGAAKARHTLIDREQALISSAFLNQAKQQLAITTESEYQRRAQDEKLLEAELLARRQHQQDYKHIQADHPNHIWAIDFVAIRFISFSLCIAVVYDVFSQAYLSIVAGSGCDHDLAKKAILAAVAKNGGLSAQLLRRDNGKAFITDSIQQLLANLFLQDAPIPPASPWFNGSLESCNSGLKTTIKTHAMQELILAPQVLKDARHSAQNAITELQNLCDKTLDTLNDKISRVKFGMPPAAVHNSQKPQVELRHQAFCEAKKSERKERMKAIQAAPKRSRLTTYADKVTSVIRRKLKQLSTDQLFVLNEIIHGRFAAIET